MCSQQLQELLARGMILRQHFEQFDLCHECPTIGARPVKLGMFRHGFNPTVKEESLLLIEHPLRITEDLFTGFVEVFRLACQLSHLRHRGNAHEKIVEPDGVWLWPVACQSSVLQTKFSGHNVVDVIFD